MKLATLYSRRSDGGTQQWTIEVDTQQGAYRTSSGIKDGVINTNEWTHCEGKNAGRSNATSAADQAVKEAQAVWRKKCDEGYREKLDEIDTKAFFEPMLAKKFEDYADRITFPVYAQPKLDGMRCIVAGDTMSSRTGKPIVSAPHVMEAMRDFRRGKARGITAEHIVFDGELYCDKLANDFNKIISLAKKGKPTAADLSESAQTLQYHIYDCMDPKSPGLTFRERNDILDELFDKAPDRAAMVRVPTVECNVPACLDELFGKWLEAGYEGQMIRQGNSVYENKRTSSLLKRKIFQDAEYPVVDILPGLGNRAGVAGAVVHSLPDGRTFKSGLIGDMDYCRRLLAEKERAIGKPATVVFFQLTPDGVPRFPKLKAIRDYE